MKVLKFIALISILFLLPYYSYSSNLGTLRISLIDGDVQIKTADTGDWVPASINMPLLDGDELWVPEDSRAELQLNTGTYLRAGEGTALSILTINRDSSQFYLAEGHVYANFNPSQESVLQLDSPVSSVRVYDSSIFRVDVSERGYTDLSVFKGTLYVEGERGKMTLDAGKMLTLRGETYAELAPLDPPDDWENWNQERDQRLYARRESYRYLPDELRVYGNDFDDNGKWIYVREYGYVWTPTVIVSVEWAPYRIGRWVWIGSDYVWISYEPWGWVPYHYGRWSYIASIGWFWVPPARGAIYWGPGYVGWVYTPTYVAWVPLAPREIYYGYGYYGPHSVNITNVNITNIQVTKVVYKNVHARNAVTSIHHDTFVKGRHVDFKLKENPFLRKKINVGRPDIKPQRATVMPIIKEIPQAKRPPIPIREFKVQELKKSRPFVRDRNASVFKPASPAKIPPLKTKDRIERQKPTRKEFEKPLGTRERVEESKPTGERIDRTKPVTEGAEKPKPAQGGIERRKPAREGAEKPQVIREETEKPKETQPAQGEIERRKPTREGAEKPQVIREETEKSKESKPTGKEVERPREFRHQETGTEKPKIHKPVGKIIEEPSEQKPQEKEKEKEKEKSGP